MKIISRNPNPLIRDKSYLLRDAPVVQVIAEVSGGLVAVLPWDCPVKERPKVPKL
jgi:hypothetical protein